MYLVMELCQLGELRSLLDKRGPFSEDSTKHIIRQLLEAITYLHRSGKICLLVFMLPRVRATV